MTDLEQLNAMFLKANIQCAESWVNHKDASDGICLAIVGRGYVACFKFNAQGDLIGLLDD